MIFVCFHPLGLLNLFSPPSTHFSPFYAVFVECLTVSAGEARLVLTLLTPLWEARLLQNLPHPGAT